MSRTLQEQIEVMQHYANGGEVEYCDNAINIWDKKDISPFDWKNIDYRIKEEKKTITIEKWLCTNKFGDFFVVDIGKNNVYEFKKVKLIESYEVKL